MSDKSDTRADRLNQWLSALPDAEANSVSDGVSVLQRKPSSYLRSAVPDRPALRSTSSISTVPSSPFIRPEEKPGYRKYLDLARSDYSWLQLTEFERQYKRQVRSGSDGGTFAGNAPPVQSPMEGDINADAGPGAMKASFLQKVLSPSASFQSDPEAINEAIDLHKLSCLLSSEATASCLTCVQSVLERPGKLDSDASKAARQSMLQAARQSASRLQSQWGKLMLGPAVAKEFWKCFAELDEAIDQDCLSRLEAASVYLARYCEDAEKPDVRQEDLAQHLAKIGEALNRTHAPLLAPARNSYAAFMQAQMYDGGCGTDTSMAHLTQLAAALNDRLLGDLSEARSNLDLFLQHWRRTFVSGTGMQHAAIHEFVKLMTAQAGHARLPLEALPVMRLLEEAEKGYSAREGRSPKLDARLKTAVTMGSPMLRSLIEMHIWKTLIVAGQYGFGIGPRGWAM